MTGQVPKARRERVASATITGGIGKDGRVTISVVSVITISRSGGVAS